MNLPPPLAPPQRNPAAALPFPASPLEHSPVEHKALEFAGPALALDAGSIASAAAHLGCEAAAIEAVVAVEAGAKGGGFLADGRPRLLFERHRFSRLTGRIHDAAHPDISSRRRGGYLGGTAEYQRLARAIRLDRKAALAASSWGLFQIMGGNHRACGFAGIEAFVAAMVSGEPAQLAAFVRFVRHAGLAPLLAARDWAGFARRYNGPAFRAHRYDERLATAYAAAKAGGRGPLTAEPTLRRGDRGPAVARLQQALCLVADGSFGPRTQAALAAWQAARGLEADGVAGPATWSALGRKSAAPAR